MLPQNKYEPPPLRVRHLVLPYLTGCTAVGDDDFRSTIEYLCKIGGLLPFWWCPEYSRKSLID
jgi:hypothetical protein